MTIPSLFPLLLLAGSAAAQVRDVPPPGGRTVELELSVWTGGVIGEPEASAHLALSPFGIRGWIRTGGELVHFVP